MVNWLISNFVKIEIELGIFFFRYYDALLCIDHKYARIKKFVSILISQLVKIEVELIYRYTDFNKIETKISLHRVSCEDHKHQGLT